MAMRFYSNSLALLAVTSLAAVPVFAEKADRLLGINGMAAAAAENTLRSRGFSHVSSHDNSMGYTYSYWWDGDDRDCVRVEEYRGMVETVADASHGDCNHSDSGAAAAVGVAVGAAILGSLLSHKSHHHQDSSHDTDQDEAFERGYRDGLHNASYHNYDRIDAYARGYEAGVDERSANLRHHSGRGGYAASARWQDLIGSRAAGGMSELEGRGFRQVDNFVSGNARYSIQWRPQSRQCIQVITADGRLENITDIQTHPKCR